MEVHSLLISGGCMEKELQYSMSWVYQAVLIYGFIIRTKVNDAVKLKEMFTTARFARCRSRFLMPVLLFENKVWCPGSLGKLTAFNTILFFSEYLSICNPLYNGWVVWQVRNGLDIHRSVFRIRIFLLMWAVIVVVTCWHVPRWWGHRSRSRAGRSKYPCCCWKQDLQQWFVSIQWPLLWKRKNTIMISLCKHYCCVTVHFRKLIIE